MASNGTRERILDVAEELFASQGISGTSLRALTRAAEVNLAAVHYHFGSKDALLDAVVERRATPLNQERLSVLEQIEARDADTPPSVEEILAAFFTPGLLSLRQQPGMSPRLSRLVARIDAQPPEVVEPLYRKHFGEIGCRFVEALQRALPELPADVVRERYRFCIGCISFLFSGNFDLDVVPGHAPSTISEEERISRLIGFLASGLRAPAPTTRAQRESPTERARCAT